MSKLEICLSAGLLAAGCNLQPAEAQARPRIIAAVRVAVFKSAIAYRIAASRNA